MPGKEYLALDTESTGLSPYKGHKLFSFQTCGQNLKPRYYDYPKDKPTLREICENPSIEKIFHNFKHDLKFIEKAGIKIRGRCHDTMVMIHLLNENEPTKALKELARKYLKDPCREEERIYRYCKKHKLDPSEEWSKIPERLMRPYALKDPELTMKLFYVYKGPIYKQFEKLYHQEMDLIPVVNRMEDRGIPFDMDKCREFRQSFRKQMKECQKRAFDLAGRSFNLSSGQQVADVLRESGFDKFIYTDKGNVVTSKKVLPKYKHPISDSVIKYRSLRTWYSTYLIGVPETIVNGVIHPHFDTLGASTGRMSCWDPNLQNQPEQLRSMYPVRKGYTNFYIDQSQIELLLMACFSDERRMIHELRKKKGDLHVVVARDIWGTHKKRKTAKTVSYTIIYGGGSGSLADTLEVPRHEADSVLTRYFTKFPAVQSFIYTVSDRIRSRGYVYNKFGRHFRVPQQIAYKGVNYLIQGTAADIIKEAMRRCDSILLGSDHNMILQEHDELIFETPDTPTFKKKYLPRIVEAMVDFDFLKLQVPLRVDIEYSTTNWGEKKTWKEKVFSAKDLN